MCDEFFGKIILILIDLLLFNVSYCDFDCFVCGLSVGGEVFVGLMLFGFDVMFGIVIVEVSWVVSLVGFFLFKYIDFENEILLRLDNFFGFDIVDNGLVQFDVNNFDQQGFFFVFQLVDGEDVFNVFIVLLIDCYGFFENGVCIGGGEVGGVNIINDVDYLCESFEIGYDYVFGVEVFYQLYVGFQWVCDEEDFFCELNGWGLIQVCGGCFFVSNGELIFYEICFQQQSLFLVGGVVVFVINLQFEQMNIEINDCIQIGNWIFNVGVMFSNDEFFGEGLCENLNNVLGFELVVGNCYKMYEVDFDEMIQLCFGVVWVFNGCDIVYVNFVWYYLVVSLFLCVVFWVCNLCCEI